MDLDGQQHQEAQLAAQACVPCRKQKRKCDKQLPSCSLCVRIGRTCDYSLDIQPAGPSPEEFAALRQQVADLHNLISSNHSTSSGISPSSNGNGSLSTGSSDSNRANGFANGTPSSWPGPSSFQSLFFLDSTAFEYKLLQIQAPRVKVPPGALAALGSSADLREMIERYFTTVHTYFPIVSKIRLYQHLSNPLHEPGADIALLFLAMKLACSEVPEDQPPQTQLYQDVKSFYHFAEAQNAFSIQTLQALLLIALFEMGHSIYPAAYLSIGIAARLGHAAGVHDSKAPQMFPRCNTWTEQEERRRLWWGVVVLDRFINIGHRGKPFATVDPDLDTHLPTDDPAWDRGEMLVAAPLSLSASQTLRVSPFARICQAAHLLGKVLRHLDDRHLPVDYRFTDALQLHRTLRAFADVLQDELVSEEAAHSPAIWIYSSMAITYSGLLTLYDGYSCTGRAIPDGGEQQLMMQKECIIGLNEFSHRALLLARKVRDVVENGGLDCLSLMVVDCIYQAAANYAWYVSESSDPTCGERLQELKELLMLLDRRWKVAGEYCRITEATVYFLSAAGSAGAI